MCFFDVRTDTFKKGLRRISNCDRSIDRSLLQGCPPLRQWSISPSDPSAGRFNVQLESDFLMRVIFFTSVGSSTKESRIHRKKVFSRGCFQISSNCFFVNSHGTQPLIRLLSSSGLEQLVPANVRCLDIPGYALFDLTLKGVPG